MIQAPNIQVLLNYETNLYTTLVSLFTAFGFPQVLIPRANIKEQENHIAVEVEMGPAIDMGYASAAGITEWSTFDCNICIYVCTDRRGDTAFSGTELATLHSDWLTKVRSVMMNCNVACVPDGQSPWNDPNYAPSPLLYYIPTVCTPMNTEYLVDERLGRDITKIEYKVRFGIPKECFPTSFAISSS